MNIQPQGEDMRKATKWILEQRKFTPDLSAQKLIDQACLKFDLSPLEADFLSRLLKKQTA